MIRALLYSLIGLLALAFMRMAMGVIMKGAGDLFNSPPEESAGATNMPPAGGELKRDPVCGTYVPATTKFTAQASGHAYYYCSKDCRDKHSVKV